MRNVRCANLVLPSPVILFIVTICYQNPRILQTVRALLCLIMIGTSQFTHILITLLTIFNTFPCMEFWFEHNWNMFSITGSEHILVQKRPQTIIWTNGGLVNLRKYASFGVSGLKRPSAPLRSRLFTLNPRITTSALYPSHLNCELKAIME